MNRQTERLDRKWMSEALIYPDGLLDRRQDAWSETDGNVDGQGNIMSERRIDSDTTALLGQ